MSARHLTNHRYYRLNINDVGTWPLGASFWHYFRPDQPRLDQQPPDILIEHESPIKGRSRALLGTAGKCVYCGKTAFNSTRPRLAEEHVISEAFGASVVLLEASCEHCASATSAAESRTLQLMFDPTRKRLGIRGKKKVMLKNKFRISVARDGIEEELNLPSDVHPTMLLMPIFLPPAALTGRSVQSESFQGFWAMNINVRPETLTAYKIQRFESSRVDTLSFCQVLAKIAHSYASSVLDPGSFEPTLCEFIRTKNKKKDDTDLNRYQFIGSTMQVEPATDNLHELGLGSLPLHGRTYLLVRTRLFANLGCPTYFVVVGYRVEVQP